MSATIAIEGILCYAYHGCLKEESVIGGNYAVDVYLDAVVDKAMGSDNLGDTADYVMVHDIVRREMAIRSKVIEHVAGRILQSLNEQLSRQLNINNVTVRVTKFNPPVNGQINKASFLISKNRQDI